MRAYYREFEQPKVIWPHITPNCRFSIPEWTTVHRRELERVGEDCDDAALAEVCLPVFGIDSREREAMGDWQRRQLKVQIGE